MSSQENYSSETRRLLVEIAEQLAASAQQLKQLAQQLSTLRSRLRADDSAATLNAPPAAKPEQA